MKEQKWKCIDGDCLFEDENGNQFYSSPEDNWFGTCIFLWTVASLTPFLMALAFKLGGM